MKHIQFLLILFAIFPCILFAQNGSVKGRIKTSDGEDAANVTVSLKGSPKAVITNIKGDFEIKNIEAGSYTLVISFVGLKKIELPIEIKQNETIHISDIVLKEDEQTLKAINVTAEQRRKYGDTIPSPSLRLNTPLIEIPQNISVVKQQTLKDFGINGTADMARLTSGVVKSAGGQNDISFSIRGTDATNNNFRDGIGGYWWNQSGDAFMVDQVEFVKGPAGFMIGNAEPGGLFNEVTKQADGKKVKEMEIGAGSYGLFRGGIDVGDKFSNKSKLSFRLVTGGQNTKGNYDFYQSHRTYVLPSIRYTYKEGSNIQLQVVRMDGFFKGTNSGNISFNGTDFLFPTTFNAVDPNAIKGISTYDNLIRLSHIHQFKNGWHLKTQIANIKGKYAGDDMYVSMYNANFDTVYREYSFIDWRNNLKAAQSFIDGRFYTGSNIEHSFLTGIDYGDSYVNVASGSFDPDNWGTHFPLSVHNPQYNLSKSDVAATTNDPDIKWGTKWLAWYGQDHIKFHDKFILTIAGRYSYTEAFTSYDSVTAYDTKFTPRAGFTWLINKNMSVYTLYDETFIPQTGRKQDKSLPKPLTGSNIELGYKAQLYKNRFFINASLFRIVKNNVLVQNPLTTFYEERGQITSQGFEMAMVGNLNRHIVLNANYSYTDAKITKDANSNNIGFRTFGVSKHATNVMIRYRFIQGTLNGFSIGSGIQFMGNRSVAYPGYTTVEEKDKTAKGYCIFDANIAYEVKRFSIHLNLFNIFNKKYMLSPWWNSSSDPAVPGYFSLSPNESTNCRIAMGYKF